jgi:sugar phosphate permease
MGSLGGLALVPSMNLLISHQGWQRATLVCGLLYLLILLPLTIPFRNRPEDMGLLPDGDATLPVTSAYHRGLRRRQHELRDYTVREAMHTRAYWLLMVGSGLRQMATLGILVSIVPILESKGLSRQHAANLAGMMFGINFVSRLLMGYLGDRWSKSLILGVNLVLESLAAFCLLFGQWSGSGITLVLLFVIFEGIGDGAGIMVWAALGEYYGRDRFATLRGYITFAFSWALIASPVYAGWVFDHFGSYDWALIPGGVCTAIASLCFFAIRKPPQLTREQPGPIPPAAATA